MTASRDTALRALEAVADPVAGGNIVSSGVVRALRITGGVAQFVMEIPPQSAEAYQAIKAQAEAALTRLDGIDRAVIVMTGPTGGPTRGATAAGAAAQQPKPPPDLRSRRTAPKKPEKIAGVDHIIAVASGKGGVGKSTVAANLACALRAQQQRVGLLDADVYGPSQPRMLGVSGRPASPDGKTILPLRNHGIPMMSMGLMVGEDQAIIWRGPMLMSALRQMLLQVQWGDLNVLVVDLPPGTGDVQMTLCQSAQVSGAIIVSTPQDVALIDARKGIDMFQKLKVPVLGMVENMSTYICSRCGHEEHIFGHGAVHAEAARRGVPLLAAVPLDLQIRVAADGGVPIVVSQPESAQAQAFHRMARQLVAQQFAPAP
ncbi:MAG: Mrp/NBP35 family ATP-binding protein [Rhodobacteraceae bacterium]|nr:Mrp/NBP35 family ATP-binding protein [Paracoccaceae bacterium]